LAAAMKFTNDGAQAISKARGNGDVVHTGITRVIELVKQFLLRAVVYLASWAIGLVVAAWIVPGVSLSVAGFTVAMVVFAVTQAMASWWLANSSHRCAPLFLGGAGLALTIVALIVASVSTHGLTIDGMASWLAATVVVWLVTTIGAITLPEVLSRSGPGPA
jgi:hypothetical protein